MQKYVLTILICMLPFFFALAHDIYLYVQNFEKGFQFSSLGYIWTHYYAESYKDFMNNSTPEVISTTKTILSEKATLICLLVGAGMFGLSAIEYIILRVMFGWLNGDSYTEQSHYRRKNSDMEFLNRSKKGQIKYKRK